MSFWSTSVSRRSFRKRLDILDQYNISKNANFRVYYVLTSSVGCVHFRVVQEPGCEFRILGFLDARNGVSSCPAPRLVRCDHPTACNRPYADPTCKPPLCLTAAGPTPSASAATLPALRRIDPVQANSSSTHVEHIAADHTRENRNRTRCAGNSNLLVFPEPRSLPHSDFSPSKPISKHVRLPLEPLYRALHCQQGHGLNRLEVPAQGVLPFAPRRRPSRTDRSCSDRDQDHDRCDSVRPPPHSVLSPETLTTPGWIPPGQPLESAPSAPVR